MRNRRKEERKEGVMYKQKGKMEREEKKNKFVSKSTHSSYMYMYTSIYILHVQYGHKEKWSECNPYRHGSTA